MTRFPSFKFILFLTTNGALVAYIPAQTLLGLLSGDQSGVAQLGGSGRDLVDAVNAGDVVRVRSYTGMITKTISTHASNEEALEAMESVGLDAIVVVDQAGIPEGVAERGRIVSRMLSALAKGKKS